MQFRDLGIGQEFDWVSPDPSRNSFNRPCMKISARKYRTTGGGPIEEFQVGSISAEVFNVKPIDAE